MVNRLVFVGLLSLTVFASVSCAPAEPPAEEEAPPPPPPPPATVYDISAVDILAEEPNFTSENVRFGDIQIGDVTNDVLDILGDQLGDTLNSVDGDYYVSAYRDLGLYIFTFKLTGRIGRIEILTPLASEVASPQLKAWLEDGDLDGMRNLMGERVGQQVEEVPETESTEYVYDLQGIRFVVYPNAYGIRFSEF